MSNFFPTSRKLFVLSRKQAHMIYHYHQTFPSIFLEFFNSIEVKGLLVFQMNHDYDTSSQECPLQLRFKTKVKRKKDDTKAVVSERPKIKSFYYQHTGRALTQIK